MVFHRSIPRRHQVTMRFLASLVRELGRVLLELGYI